MSIYDLKNIISARDWYWLSFLIIDFVSDNKWWGKSPGLGDNLSEPGLRSGLVYHPLSLTSSHPRQPRLETVIGSSFLIWAHFNSRQPRCYQVSGEQNKRTETIFALRKCCPCSNLMKVAAVLFWCKQSLSCCKCIHLKMTMTYFLPWYYYFKKLTVLGSYQKYLMLSIYSDKFAFDYFYPFI